MFSLLLCTLNRPELLNGCIESLLCQTYQDFEIIIVDQSDEVNDTNWTDMRIKYIHISKKGLSNARNVGLEHVTRKYVCLVDDDAVYPENWLENIARSLENSPADILCGRIIDPVTKKIMPDEHKFNRVRSVSIYEVMSCGMSAACIFSAHHIKQVGFDDCFGVGRHWGAGEESDAIFSMMDRGQVMQFDPSIVVFHPLPNKSEISQQRIYSYNLGFGALFAKHLVTTKKTVYLMYFLYLLLRNIGGTVVYTIKMRKDLCRCQIISFKGKLVGFYEYIHRSDSGGV